MTLSRADAAAALQDIDAATTRSRALHGYQRAAPHLIIWGVAWAVGYTVTDLAPAWTGPAWLSSVVIATGGDIAAARSGGKGEGNGALFAAVFAIFLIFIGATIAVMGPHEPKQVGAFIPLVVAAVYAVIGLMDAPRMLVLGGALAALTLFGFFALPAHFLLWMAVVGGGSLILGGIWLRRT